MPTGFNIADHHDFVQRHGESVRWYRGSQCPCGSLGDANRSRTTCIHCVGTGTRYEAPKTLTAIVTGVTRDKNLLDAGVADPGDCLMGLSPRETEMLSDWDMIELQWEQGQPFEGDVLIRGSGATDVLSYPPKKIFSCVQIDATTQVLTSYVEGVNFTVAGRVLTWTVAQPQPAVGQAFSIKYSAVFQWIVFRSPFDRREQDVNLGQRVLLKKRENVRRS